MQGEVLESEVAVAAAEERAEAKQMEQIIESGSSPDESPQINHLPSGGVWRGTGCDPKADVFSGR